MDLNEIPITELQAEIRRRKYDAERERWHIRLKDLRAWLGINQEEASDYMECSQAYICMCEKGNRVPGAEAITCKLIELLVLSDDQKYKIPRE